MRIAINTRFLISSKMEGFGQYTYEIVKRLVENHPEHHFILFFDRSFDPKFIFGRNVTPVILRPAARHPLLFILWFEVAVYNALKKFQADVFLSPDGYLSLRSKVPQIAVIHDLNFEHYPEDIPFTARIYLRHFFPRFAKKAAKIITVSNYSKQDIIKTYLINEDKITVAWNDSSDLFVPIPDIKQNVIREKLTKGKPYFLFVGALHPRKNVTRLLEAYTKYRETENPTYELVIVGETLWKNSSFKLQLSDSVKQTVHFTGYLPLEELPNVMGAASIFTFIPYFEGFGIPMVEAMKCAVPIIAGNLTSLPEIGEDSVLYCDPFDVQDIFEKMNSLSKDESQRAILSNYSLTRSAKFSWDRAADIVWAEVEKIIEKPKI